MSNTGAVAKHTSDMLGKIGEVMATKWAKELQEEKEDIKKIITFTVQNYLKGQHVKMWRYRLFLEAQQ